MAFHLRLPPIRSSQIAGRTCSPRLSAFSEWLTLSRIQPQLVCNCRGRATGVRSPVAIWPLVGRNKELSQLTAAISARRGAVITGSAGVGKTTLAVTGLEWAGERGVQHIRTTATKASRGLPFGAFASILPPDQSDPLSREDHTALLRRYVRAVTEGAGGRPLLVFVDDAHHLDNGSATLVHQLAVTRAATVLATVRSTEVVPDAVVAMWKDGPPERIEVGVLGDVAIEELLVAVLGGPVDAASVRQLSLRCEGNPLYLRELVTGALEAGALVDAGGIWRLRDNLRPTARLVELVALRLGDLTRSERAVLELLALGEPLDELELAELANPAVVEALEDKGLISSRIEGRSVKVWLAHPVYGDVVRVGIGALREQGITRSLADVIEAARGPQADRLLVASLRLVGGGGSAELFLAGAVTARARHDHSLTERMAQAAIAEGSGFEARLLAAEAAHFLGRPDQAEQELAELADYASIDSERARVALLRFHHNHSRQPRETDLRLIDDALDMISEPLWRDKLAAHRFFVRSFGMGPGGTVKAGSAVLELPSSEPLTPVVAALSYSLNRTGRFEEGVQLVGRTSRPLIPAADEEWDSWVVFISRVDRLAYAGHLKEAEELLTRAYATVIDQPAAVGRAFITGWFAAVHLEQGRPRIAFQRASESYTLFQQLGFTAPARWSYIAAAWALALAGRAEQAAETLAALDSLGLPPILVNEVDLLQARAWTAVAGGKLHSARDHLDAAVELGRRVGDLVGAASALHGLARLGQARRVTADLNAISDKVEGNFVAARCAHATALAARSTSDLARVSAQFEGLGAVLYAAEASAEAAVLLRRAGTSREAAAAELRASQLLGRCEGVITPAVQAISTRARLTPGELDASMQAAAGRSNKEIAAEMHYSVRTVETHLQRVYEKLGINGRRELADALRNERGVGPPDL